VRKHTKNPPFSLFQGRNPFSLSPTYRFIPPPPPPPRLTASRLQIPTITQTISTYRQHIPYRLTTQGLQMPTITQTISIFHQGITNAYHYTDHIDLPPRELRIDLPPRDCKCLPLHTPYRLTASRLQLPTITDAISIFQFTFASTYRVFRFSSSLSPLHIECFDSTSERIKSIV